MDLPATFGKYRLEKFLGGGMSHVYSAVDTVLQRPVAVKILTEEGCRDQDAKRRFLQEARMCSSIAHDNIIRLHDYGEQDGKPYIVMELLTGEDLRTAIEKNHISTLPSKLRVALQVTRALGHIHALNIVHRDIKPENLHIDHAGRVRLMDFGIAKAENMSLTRTGFAVGTPYYMAPEQLMAKPITHAVDIYAFGIVLYELLTGAKPLNGESVESLFYLILQQPLNLEPLQKAGLPAPLIELVARCANKKPEDRPASFDAIGAEIEDLLEKTDSTYLRPTTGGVNIAHLPPLPPAAPPAPPTPGNRRNLWLALGGVAAAIVAAVIFWPSGKTPQPPRKTDETNPPAAILEPTIRNEFGAMMLVPAGAYKWGQNGETRELPAFYIDKTEVSVGQWNRYAQEMNRAGRPQVADNLPVTDVTFDDATGYCGWAGKRLPSGEEWEKAARGTDGRKYPWGAAEEPSRANVGGASLQPVESFLDGASPYGALNLAGNAWEWVRQEGAPSQGLRDLVAKQMREAKFAPLTAEDVWFVVRGGGFDFKKLDGATAWETLPMPGRYKGPAIGFRCARSAP